ncbi:TPA: hypothetical protein ACIAHZ_004022 [Enterobacter roggenkampii]
MLKIVSALFLFVLFLIGKEENVRLVAILWSCWALATIYVYSAAGMSGRDSKLWSNRKRQVGTRNYMRRSIVSNGAVMTLFMFALISRSFLN